ncbi:NAD(P)H-dependent oxidoreductase [Cronobacter dublinensis]|uniref:NAD(P)H-dependent oxidoreductase n=1 Tax=Cronobacter dublinensis TaxID=413497 RepID=UPI0010720AB9|nr:FMN-dependent NADH-azoreductase [Cronobacter dublinensis subsp. dublinensis]EKK4083663.1 NAD(P)H-dependent oxidoreductase [Cronobacter dublinensis]EGT5692184.1 FMN-dependent NADH-azoreductase [Cronobacter dublinensis subsp. dublinensis]EGT5730016.1 FMN-dependent NADH-azoreductase [Cronobacter dublinensis subsp. dublinensis]EGT5734183.1 FMN-dependent NADH-azoreductase [Cronobacter dublinensis subsp. dublinensis]
MKILHIDSSIAGEDSISRQLSQEIVRSIMEAFGVEKLSYRDLIKDEIQQMNWDIAMGFRPGPGDMFFSENVTKEHRFSDMLVNEFLASDVVVIGAPMYNFSVASQLKSWLDRIAQPGKTFRYTEHGPIGLVKDKTVIIASCRGGFYKDLPLEDMDFQERYLESFFNFLGVKSVQYIRAEGMSRGDEIREGQIDSAFSQIPFIIENLN